MRLREWLDCRCQCEDKDHRAEVHPCPCFFGKSLGPKALGDPMETVGGNGLMTVCQVAAACDATGCLQRHKKPRVAVDSA
jgi:hypothetical protein